MASAVLRFLDAASAEVNRNQVGDAVKAELAVEIAESYAKLGGYFTVLENSKKAEALFRVALEIRRSGFGDGSTEAAEAMSGLGASECTVALLDDATTPALAQRKEERQQEAIRLLRDAFAIQRRAFGENAIASLTTLQRLGRALASVNTAESSSLLERNLERRTEQFGTTSIETIEALVELGILRDTQRRANDAEVAFRSAYLAGKESLRDHPLTATSAWYYADRLAKRKDFESAGAVWREAIDIRERKLGRDDPVTLTIRNNYAMLVLGEGQKQWSEAEFILRDITQRRLRLLSERHGSTLRSLNNWARALSKLGRLEVSEQRFKEAIALADEHLPTGHEDRWSFRRFFGESLTSWKRFADAEQCLSEALRLCRASKPDHDAATQCIFQSIIDLYDAWQKPESAAEYRVLLIESESPN